MGELVGLHVTVWSFLVGYNVRYTCLGVFSPHFSVLKFHIKCKQYSFLIKSNHYWSYDPILLHPFAPCIIITIINDSSRVVWAPFESENIGKIKNFLNNCFIKWKKSCSAGADLEKWSCSRDLLRSDRKSTLKLLCLMLPLCSMMKSWLWNVSQCFCWNYKHFVEWQ